MRASAKFVGLSCVLSAYCCLARPADAPQKPNDAADDLAKEASYADLILKHVLAETSGFIDTHGQLVRTGIFLRECRLDGLAETVEPSDADLTDSVASYVGAHGLDSKLASAIWAGVRSSVSFYEIGFKDDAVALHRLHGNKFCQDATESAIAVMRERASR